MTGNFPFTSTHSANFHNSIYTLDKMSNTLHKYSSLTSCLSPLAMANCMMASARHVVDRLKDETRWALQLWIVNIATTPATSAHNTSQEMVQELNISAGNISRWALQQRICQQHIDICNCNVYTSCRNYAGLMPLAWWQECHSASWQKLCSINLQQLSFKTFPSVLPHCWLGDRKGIRTVKKTWCWFVGGDDLTGALHDL